MSAADADAFARAVIEYCVIVGGAFIVAFVVYLFIGD